MKSVSVAEIKSNSFNKYYITIDLNDCDTDKIKELYENTLSMCSGKNIKMVYEKVFGLVRYKSAFYSMREQAVINRCIEDFPSSYIEGEPISGSAIASVVLCGVSEDAKVEYVLEEGTTRGSIIETPRMKSLYLADMNTYTEAGISDRVKMDEFFESVEELIESTGFKVNDIARNWFYLNDIYPRYVDFNEARNSLFDSNNIDYSVASNDLPASTCIEGKTEDDSILTMDCICIDKSLKYPICERVYSQKQNDPDGVNYENKPSFSRAMAIKYDEYTELHVSGTASINKKGESVDLDDPEKQIRNTLENVQHLLNQYDMDYPDFLQATIFLKHKEYYDILIKVLNDMKISPFTPTIVCANVCRDNLLVEIDGIGVKSI